MKYLQAVATQAEDLLNKMYDDVYTPSVRYIEDADSIALQEFDDNIVENIWELSYIYEKSMPEDSGMTLGEYVDKIADGTYTSSYTTELTNGLTFSEIEEKYSKVFDEYPEIPDFTTIEGKMGDLYAMNGNYYSAETKFVYAISNKKDLNVNNSATINYSILDASGNTIASATSSTTVVNQYQSYVDCYDFNESGDLDDGDLLILKVFRKYFPEFSSIKAYTKALTLISSDDNNIRNAINCVLGLSEYDETYDINGNGEVDKEDLTFFMSAYIFREMGMNSSTSAYSSRHLISSDNQDTLTSSIRPPRTNNNFNSVSCKITSEEYGNQINFFYIPCSVEGQMFIESLPAATTISRPGRTRRDSVPTPQIEQWYESEITADYSMKVLIQAWEIPSDSQIDDLAINTVIEPINTELRARIAELVNKYGNTSERYRYSPTKKTEFNGKTYYGLTISNVVRQIYYLNNKGQVSTVGA